MGPNNSSIYSGPLLVVLVIIRRRLPPSTFLYLFSCLPGASKLDTQSVMAPSQPSLGLSSLQSFSPSWSPDLRLVTCIATKYAAQRCVERINALTGANGGPDSEERTRNEFADQWNEYSEKVGTHRGLWLDEYR